MKKRFIFLLIHVMLALVSYSQTTASSGLSPVLDKLEQYSKSYPSERVYLQLDKPYYAAGDDIWFKAYISIGALNYPSSLSSVLYVELIAPDGAIVYTERLPIISGLSVGDFKLADSLAEGNYRIRAYTQWMQNFDGRSFCDRTIAIGNILSDGFFTTSTFHLQHEGDKLSLESLVQVTDTMNKPLSGGDIRYRLAADGLSQVGKGGVDGDGRLTIETALKSAGIKEGLLILDFDGTKGRAVKKIITVKNPDDKPSIQFFPEGGIIVAGVLGKIGFKALKSSGLGSVASGYIHDGHHNRIQDFTTDYAGMGHLMLQSQPGESYTATVRFENGDSSEVPLPAVLPQGVVLSVNNEREDKAYVQISANEAFVKGQNLSLLAQKEGLLCYTAQLKLDKTDLVLSIPRTQLPTGIVQLTLLDDQEKPVSERLFFNWKQQDFLPLEIVTDKPVYGSKENVVLRLQSGSEGDSSRVGNFSIAVTDISKAPADEAPEPDILSAFLLSTGLKGYIETPGYYFEGINAQKMQQLDNLLLTQGWSHIVWNKLLNDQFPAPRFPPETNLRISGRIGRGKNMPVPHAHVSLLSTEHIGSMIDTTADELGRFVFDRLFFNDSTKFVIQARDDRGKKNVDISMDETVSPSVGPNPNIPDERTDVNRSLKTYLLNSKMRFSELQQYGLMDSAGIMLQEVSVTANAPSKVLRSANLNGPGKADQVMTADELANAADLETFLRGRLMGVNFIDGIPYSTRTPAQADPSAPPTPMQIVLDGIYLDMDQEAQSLSTISPQEVQTIEVLRSPATTSIYGPVGLGGVMVITTKQARTEKVEDIAAPGILNYYPKGYYVMRQFYSPDYSKPQKYPEMKDLRSTVYWNPDVATDNNGEAHLSFYTTQGPGKYRIVVEGMDSRGRLGRSVSYIEVKR